jgi:A/G-specific adenine glycosylase
MQQTRIDQGLPYYEAFTEQFPTVYDLAKASEDQVLNLWQGLGYYNRARNLHHTAQVIASDYAGTFPEAYDELIKLKGIGEYTAAAIASMAFDKPHAVVDGNVNRVIARLFGIQEPVNTNAGKKAVKSWAEALLDHSEPGNFNEALMDFGAIQCTASTPKCGICPLQDYCYAFLHNQTTELPRKAKKLKRRTRYFYYLVMANSYGVALRQRGTDDVWQRMYDFPLVEKSPNEPFQVAALNELAETYKVDPTYLANYKHVLTHQDIIANFYLINSFDLAIIKEKFIFIPWEELSNYALPRLIDRFLKAYMEELV